MHDQTKCDLFRFFFFYINCFPSLFGKKCSWILSRLRNASNVIKDRLLLSLGAILEKRVSLNQAALFRVRKRMVVKQSFLQRSTFTSSVYYPTAATQRSHLNQQEYLNTLAPRLIRRIFKSNLHDLKNSPCHLTHHSAPQCSARFATCKPPSLPPSHYCYRYPAQSAAPFAPPLHPAAAQTTA